MRRIFVIAFFLAVTGVALYLAIKLHRNSEIDKIYKYDYFIANQIKYGLLSGDKWTYQVNAIIANQIDSFALTKDNKKVLRKQINSILSRLIDEADVVLHKERDNTIDRIKFKVINAVVDLNDFRPEIPKFTDAILSELEKSKNKDQLKQLLKDKVSGILNSASQDTTGEQYATLRKYNVNTLEELNDIVSEKTHEIKKEQQTFGYILIGSLAAVLFMWLYILTLHSLYATSFLFSVLISFMALSIGVTLPMIEIDARIGMLDLHLLSSHIIFKDQVIFFQTKSILDVIHILIVNGKADSLLVGILILMFSVLFPVTKLICTTIYLYSKKRANRFVRYMAFNSGKWSMADVMVIAIFMSYVGFQGILDDQLADITVHKDSINLLTTNRTSLQTGFVLFVSFVIFNLVLAEILKRITRERDAERGDAEQMRMQEKKEGTFGG
jgi:hypothetical protein